MKKFIISVLFLTGINIFCISQVVNIPDANFKNYLLNNSAINTNSNNEIEVSEATLYTGAIIANGLNISDMTGIEAFTSITHLECYNNLFTSLDIKNGNNSNIIYFNARYNPNLSCIQVDNAAWSTSNWIEIDSCAFFSENCGATGLPSTLTLNNPATTVSIANICSGSIKVPIHAFCISTDGTTGNGNLTNFQITTTGTYSVSDISNFKIWYNSTNDLSTATLLSTKIPVTVAGVQNFPAFTCNIPAATTYYFWVTMDLNVSPVNNNTITVNASVSTDMTTTLTRAGSANTSGVQTIKTIPTITATTPGSRCDIGTITLGATASAGTINWYTASTGGSALGTGTSFNTPSISTTTTYYVDATNAGCTTASRTSVVATVNTTPTITGTTPNSRCGTGTVVLGSTSSAGTINWFAAATGGASLGTGTSFTTPSLSATTNYYVDATDNGCTSATRSAITATINAVPIITGTTPASRCGTGTVVLGTTSSAGTINWYAASTGGSSLGTGTSFTTPSISATTTYYVDATSGGCTTATRSAVTATVNVIPTITGTTPASRCDAGTVVLGATSSAGTINWYAASTGGTSLGTGTSYTTPSISATTTYYVDATSTGCTTPSRTAIDATVNPVPIITSESKTDVTICGGNDGTITISATGTGLTYSINGGSTYASNGGIFTGLVSASYPIAVMNASGCVTNGSILSIGSGGAPLAPVAGTNATYCSGTTATNLTATAGSGGSITWYSNPSLTTPIGTGSSLNPNGFIVVGSNNFYVTETVSGCQSPATIVTITVNAIPSITGTTPGSRCNAGTVVLGATASAGTINWYAALTGGSSLGTGTNYTTSSISSTTTYYVDATNNACTTGTRTSVVATIIPTPSITSTIPGSRCDAGTVVLGATASAGTINWYAALTGGSSLGTGTSYTTPGISSTTTYYVDATNNGCTTVTRTAVVATVTPTPTITGTTPGSRCGTGTVVLGATASAGIINWYAASTGGSSLGTGTSFTTPSISSSTIYYIDATNNGCTTGTRTTINAIINSIDTTNISQSICSGDYVDFYGTLLYNQGIYYHTLNSSQNCDSVIALSLVVYPTYNIPQNISICNGQSYVFNSHIYTQNGSYNDTLQSIYGCDSIIVTNLTVNALPIINLGNDTTICANSSITLSAGNSGNIYHWSNGLTSPTILVSSSGIFSVTVTNINNCSNSDSIIVSKYSPINIQTSVVNTACGQQIGSVSTSVSGGTLPYEYFWNNGDTTSAAQNLSAGVYIVTVTDLNSCQHSASAAVSSLNGASISNIQIIHVSCFGGSNGAININVSGGIQPYHFEWSNGDTIHQNITNLTAGPYEVVVTDASNCHTVQSFYVTEPSQLLTSTSINNATCGNADGQVSLTVTGGTSPYTYQWSNGANTSQINSASANVYYITITDNNNCMKQISAAVSESGAATIIIDSIQNASCNSNDGAIFISVSGGTNFTYNWSDFSTSQNLQNVPAGNYSVTVTSGGCNAIASATITQTLPLLQPICIVTVEIINNASKNKLIWEKQQTQGISYYKIWKETTQSGVYQMVTTVPYDAMSTWIDPNSNPHQRSWRYKINSVDSCGIESPLSSFHKTMHLTVNLGQGQDINLIWNHYEGFMYGTYYIHRYQPSTGWELIDSIPGDLNTYTDTPTGGGTVKYKVEAKRANECWASGIAKDMTGPFSQSLSNIEDNGIIEVNIPQTQSEIIHYEIYPNPTNDMVFIKSEKVLYIKVFNIIGDLIYTSNTRESNSILLHQKGIYMFELSDGKNITYRKVVVR